MKLTLVFHVSTLSVFVCRITREMNSAVHFKAGTDNEGLRNVPLPNEISYVRYF